MWAVAAQYDVCVDELALQGCIVRIENRYGATHGTGFVAAPGWVLTNAHVVAGLAEVVVRPEVSPERTFQGRVVVASDPPTDTAQPLWPFPDVAVIEVVEFTDPVCALVDNRPLTLTADLAKGLVGWGYPQRGDESRPLGDPAHVSVIGPGPAAAPYWRVGDDWVGHGMSGAPVVSLDRGAVVGMLVATLDHRAQAGGWFTPLADLPGSSLVGPELAEQLRTIIDSSRREIQGRSARWSSVIKVVDVEGYTLKKSPGPFQRGQFSSPAELLLAQNMVVDYLFYDEEIDATVAWATGPEPVAVAGIVGSGGSGKSRFALELADRLEQMGWTTAELRDLDRDAAVALRRAPVPRLIVVDYADSDWAEVEQFLKGLLHGASSTAPARVVLLSRELRQQADWGGQRTRYASRDPRVQRLVTHRHPIETATRALSLADRRDLFTAALPKLAHAWGIDPAPAAAEIDLSDPQYATALAVSFAALDTVLSVEAPVPDRPGPQNPADRILEHEARYWRQTAPGGATADQLALSIALATLFGGHTHQADLEPLIIAAGIPQGMTATALATWAATFYSHDTATQIQPLRPDRLGERLIEQALLAGPTSPLENLFPVATNTQCAHAIEVLARGATNSPILHQHLVRALGNLLPNLIERVVTTTKHGPQVLDKPLAAALIDVLAGPLGQAILHLDNPQTDP